MSPQSQPIHTGTRDTSTFPVESLTSEQHKSFTHLIESRKQIPFNRNEPIWLALLLTCEKPGALLTPLYPGTSGKNDSIETTPEDIATTFGLYHKQWDDDIWYITRNQWRLEFLPAQIGTTDGHARRLGCFFGYPTKDINHFINTYPTEATPEELVFHGIFSPEDIAYTIFLPQRHNDSVRRYQMAIAEGKRIYSIIERRSRNWELPQLKAYADTIYSDAVDKFSLGDGNM